MKTAIISLDELEKRALVAIMRQTDLPEADALRIMVRRQERGCCIECGSSDPIKHFPACSVLDRKRP